MRFINFQKWIEQEAAPTAVTSTQNTDSGATLGGDISKVPSRAGCVNCSKDFKNWYYKRRKK